MHNHTHINRDDKGGNMQTSMQLKTRQTSKTTSAEEEKSEGRKKFSSDVFLRCLNAYQIK